MLPHHLQSEAIVDMLRKAISNEKASQRKKKKGEEEGKKRFQ